MKKLNDLAELIIKSSIKRCRSAQCPDFIFLKRKLKARKRAKYEDAQICHLISQSPLHASIKNELLN